MKHKFTNMNCMVLHGDGIGPCQKCEYCGWIDWDSLDEECPNMPPLSSQDIQAPEESHPKSKSDPAE